MMADTIERREDEDTYNGWANYETWNVALWLGNDEGSYSFAREYRHRGWVALAGALSEIGVTETGDGVSYHSPRLDHDELNEWLSEL